jgi:hypothetical protein
MQEEDEYTPQDRESAERPGTDVINIDGWNTRASDVFPNFIEIVKTRKDGDPISIHVDPVKGRVRKFAGETLFNPRIEKEERLWHSALTLFEVHETVEVGVIRRLKSDPSKGYEEVKYIDMPYMGLPINHYRNISSSEIPSEAREQFTQRMITLVERDGVFFPDMNEGNVLVRVVNGQEVLFPIDWESAQTNRVAKNVAYYIEETRKRCSKLFGK